MTIFGDGTQERAFTHVDDVAPIIARSVESYGARNQIFNVGADVPHTVNNLAQVVAEAMHAECNVVHLAPRNEVKIAYSDHSKAQSVFGQHELKSLRQGIAAMATWVNDHGARESNIFEGIEIERNMPASWAKVLRGHSSHQESLSALEILKAAFTYVPST
jgi:UDP-glucose 4-epimerase